MLPCPQAFNRYDLLNVSISTSVLEDKFLEIAFNVAQIDVGSLGSRP